MATTPSLPEDASTLGYHVDNNSHLKGLQIDGVEKKQIIERSQEEVAEQAVSKPDVPVKSPQAAPSPAEKQAPAEVEPKLAQPRREQDSAMIKYQAAPEAQEASVAQEKISNTPRLGQAQIAESQTSRELQKRAEGIRFCRIARLAELQEKITAEQAQQEKPQLLSSQAMQEQAVPSASRFRFFQTNSDSVKIILCLKIIRAALAVGERVAIVGRFDEATLVRRLEASGVRAARAVVDKSLLFLAKSTSDKRQLKPFFASLKKKAVADIDRVILLDFQDFVDTSSEAQANQSLEVLHQVLNSLSSNVVAQFYRDGSQQHLNFRKACRSLVPCYHELTFDKRKRKLRVGSEKLIEIDVAPMMREESLPG